MTPEGAGDHSGDQPGSADYSTDATLTDPNHDLFSRYEFAERIAGTIATRADDACLVVAIEGEWGAGKSTVLNFLEHALGSAKTQAPPIVVRFNPNHNRE